jgi:hypothetical protein
MNGHMNGLVPRLAPPAPVKPQQTYLDLPDEMAEAYMDAVFQSGADSEAAHTLYAKYSADKEWGALFCEFAEGVHNLKAAVSGGATEARAVEAQQPASSSPGAAKPV